MKDMIFYLVIGGLVLNALGFLFLNLALRTNTDDEDEYEEYEEEEEEDEQEETNTSDYDKEEKEEKYPNASAYENVQKQPSFFQSQFNGMREIHIEMDKAPVMEQKSFFEPKQEEEVLQTEPIKQESVVETTQQDSFFEDTTNKRKTFDDVDLTKADEIEQEYLEEQKEKEIFHVKHFEPLKYQPKVKKEEEKEEPVSNEENVRNHLDAILKELDNKK